MSPISWGRCGDEEVVPGWSPICVFVSVSTTVSHALACPMRDAVGPFTQRLRPQGLTRAARSKQRAHPV